MRKSANQTRRARIICSVGCIIAVIFVIALDVVINRSMDRPAGHIADAVEPKVPGTHAGARGGPMALHNDKKSLSKAGRRDAFPVHTYGIELEMGLKEAKHFNEELYTDKDSFFMKIFNQNGFTGYNEHKSKIVKDGANWRLSLEDDPGYIIEVASPKLNTWDVVPRLANMTTALRESGHFHWEPKTCGYCSMHVTVDGSCLMDKMPIEGHDSALRVLNLVAVWEALHPLLQPTFAQRRASKQYGGSMKQKSPNLLKGLMSTHNTTVASLANIFQAKGYEDLVLGKPSYMGFRNLVVNLCHLMPGVDCCNGCSHNRKPKHSGIEFRMFDVATGPKLETVVNLAQYTMQYVCSLPKDKDIRHVASMDAHLSKWIKKLGLDEPQFQKSIAENPHA